MNDLQPRPARSSLIPGLVLGFLCATAIAGAGVVAWSAGLSWLGAGESPAVADLRRRLLEQEQRWVQLAAESRSAAASAERPQADAAELDAERARAERAEKAADEARGAALALREELARTKTLLEELQSEVDEHLEARAKLESAQSAMLERALAAEMRERERDSRRAASESVAPAPQIQTLMGSSSFLEDVAKNIPAELLGPPPSADSAKDAAPAPGADRRAAEERAEEEAAAIAAKRGALDELRAQANRLLELDGYTETQLVRIGSMAEGVLRDVAFREVGPLGETRRFLAAKELRFEAFPGLRSLRVHLIDGYEQKGSGASAPFENGASELTFADVRIDDWKALLVAQGLWRETGAASSGKVDARYPAAATLGNVNELFARAKGTRRFVLRRLDEVQSGARWRGVELHQLEVGGGGLQVIYEAESAELWWDPAQKSAELRLEHGFQRRGSQRVPFFEKRARVFLGFEDDKGWDAAMIPFQVVGPAAR